MDWYYGSESNEQIKFAPGELKNLIDSGVIKPDTLVYNSTMTNWTAASVAVPHMFAQGPGSANNNQSPSNDYFKTVPTSQPYTPPADVNYPTYHTPPSDGTAIASLVCGIVAVLLSCPYPLGFLFGIPAVICGHLSTKKTRANQHPTQGMAIAGLVMGYFSIAYLLIVIVLGVVGVFFAMNNPEIQEAMKEAMEQGMKQGSE